MNANVHLYADDTVLSADTPHSAVDKPPDHLFSFEACFKLQIDKMFASHESTALDVSTAIHSRNLIKHMWNTLLEN